LFGLLGPLVISHNPGNAFYRDAESFLWVSNPRVGKSRIQILTLGLIVWLTDFVLKDDERNSKFFLLQLIEIPPIKLLTKWHDDRTLLR